MSYREIEERESNVVDLRGLYFLTNWKNMPQNTASLFDVDWSSIPQGLKWYIAYRQNVDPKYPQQLLNIPVSNSFADPSKHYDLNQMGLLFPRHI